MFVYLSATYLMDFKGFPLLVILLGRSRMVELLGLSIGWASTFQTDIS